MGMVCLTERDGGVTNCCMYKDYEALSLLFMSVPLLYVARS